MIPVIDGHNDLPWASREKRGYTAQGLDGAVPGLHTDVPRMREGGLAAQFWSLWVDPVLEGSEQVTATLEQIDFVHRLVAAAPDQLALARTAAEVRAALKAGKIASLMGSEGGAQIDSSLAVLRQYARAGMRYMTLTWNRTTEWADSATDAPRHGGLSAFGRDVVREMNRIGVLVDLSHVAPSTMRAALEISTRPVLTSHSSALGICDHPRNVPDDVMRTIGESGGVQMVTFVPRFVSQEVRDYWELPEDQRPAEAPQATLSQVADHVEYVREVAGVHAVGLGGDFDGTDLMPVGLEDVSTYPALLDELRSRRWSEPELRALAHENVLRVLEASDPAYEAFLAGADAGTAEPAGVTPRVDASTREGAA